MKARDFQTKSVDELKSWVESSMRDDFQPTLAVVFTSLPEQIPEVYQILHARGIAVFGASSWGEFARDGVELGSMSVLLLDMPESCFYLRLDELSGGDEEAVTASVAEETLNRFAKPVVMVLFSDLRTNGEDILKTFEKVLGDDAEVAGGGAGTTAANQPSYVFTGEASSRRGMLTMVIDGDCIQMTSRAACGWQAVGAPRKITKSDGQWVYEIDGVPALDALLKYIGREDLDLDDPVEWELEVNTLPLQLQRPNGDPIMRPALLYDKETRAVMCPGRMEEGSMIRFSIEPDESVIDTVLKDFKQEKDRVGDIDAVVYFSCWGRWNSLGPAMNREVREAGKLFGVPMIGLLSSGEMARATGGKLELNALTSCCVMLKEIEG